MNVSARQRSKGTWQLRYDGRPDAIGQRRRINATVKGTRKEAEKALRECL